MENKQMEIKGETALQVKDDISPVENLRNQIRMMDEIYKTIMIRDIHYGLIPGCGKKPSLFKAGAEKITSVFRLAPHYEIKRTDLPGNNLTYEIICTLKHRETGQVWGQGVGAVSSIETKFKRENPADVFNNVLKIGKKRALVDAALGLGISDIFTQDLEDLDAASKAYKEEKGNGEDIIPQEENTQTLDLELLQIATQLKQKDSAKFNKDYFLRAMGIIQEGCSDRAHLTEASKRKMIITLKAELEGCKNEDGNRR